jgi:hypothetical protein
MLKKFCNETHTINSRIKNDIRVHNSIVVYVCQMNFFYVFIVLGPILRYLGEFGKIRLLPGENTRFLPKGGGVSMGI